MPSDFLCTAGRRLSAHLQLALLSRFAPSEIIPDGMTPGCASKPGGLQWFGLRGRHEDRPVAIWVSHGSELAAPVVIVALDRDDAEDEDEDDDRDATEDVRFAALAALSGL